VLQLVEGNSKKSCFHNFSFLLARHREPQSSSPSFSICDFRNPNSPTPVGTNWPHYTTERGEYMGLSPNMTVRYKLRPDKMALWNEFLPSLGETVEPTTRSDVSTTGKADDKKGTTTKS